MFTIVVRGPTEAVDDDFEPIDDPVKLKSIGGLVYDEDVCSNYLDPALQEIGITGGDLRLEYNSSKKELEVVTEYLSPRELTKKELKALRDDTAGQWGDGLGAGCFENLLWDSGYGVELNPGADTPHIEQAPAKKQRARQANTHKKKVSSGKKKASPSVRKKAAPPVKKKVAPPVRKKAAKKDQ